MEKRLGRHVTGIFRSANPISSDDFSSETWYRLNQTKQTPFSVENLYLFHSLFWSFSLESITFSIQNKNVLLTFIDPSITRFYLDTSTNHLIFIFRSLDISISDDIDFSCFKHLAYFQIRDIYFSLTKGHDVEEPIESFKDGTFFDTELASISIGGQKIPAKNIRQYNMRGETITL